MAAKFSGVERTKKQLSAKIAVTTNKDEVPSKSGEDFGKSVSSNHMDSSGEITQTHITETPSLDVYSTSGILYYCKKKILMPYLCLLSMLGWRSFVTRLEGPAMARLNWIYLVGILAFNMAGYVLQVICCFRRDHPNRIQEVACAEKSAFDYPLKLKPCYDSSLLVFILPSLLHQIAYFSAFYLLRIADNEQIQTSMERVFLQTFHTHTGYLLQPKLVRTLRWYLIGGVIWVVISLACSVMYILVANPTFVLLKISCDNDKGVLWLTILLALTLVWQDIIHMAMIISYTVQCQLLMCYLYCLAERTREKSIILQDAAKDLLESTKMLKYINEELSTPVCFMMLYSGSMAVSGIFWLVNLANETELEQSLLALTAALLSTALWTFVFLLPIVMASRLSAAFNSIRKLGLAVHARPFGYQDSPQVELDSFLLFMRSIKAKAKLFRIPIIPKYLLLITFILSFVALVIIFQGNFYIGF